MKLILAIGLQGDRNERFVPIAQSSNRALLIGASRRLIGLQRENARSVKDRDLKEVVAGEQARVERVLSKLLPEITTESAA